MAATSHLRPVPPPLDPGAGSYRSAQQPTLETFDGFLADPLVLGRLKIRTAGEVADATNSATAGSSRTTPLTIALVTVTAGFTVLLAVSGAQSTVGTFSWDQLTADLAAAWTANPSELSSDKTFPLLRDWPNLLAATIAFLTPAVVARQWMAMRTYVRDLYNEGVLYDDAVSPGKYSEWVSRENEALDRYGRFAPVSAVFALILALLITRTQSAVGVFGAMGGSGDFAREAYEGWWAGSAKHFAGNVTYLIITWLFMYFVLVQNLVGQRLVRFMLRTRSHLRVGYDLYNGDGAYGWMPMRKLLATVYLSLTLHAIAIVVLGFTTQAGALVQWLLPITILYLAVVPLYVFLPLWLFGRRRSALKRSDLQKLGGELTDCEAEIADASRRRQDTNELYQRHEVLRWKLATVQDVPLTPFRTRALVAAVLLYLIPASAAIIQSFDILAS